MVRQRIAEDLEAASGSSPNPQSGAHAASPDRLPSTPQQQSLPDNASIRPYRTNERTDEDLRDMFRGPDGQCLLFAFKSSKKGEYKAVLVPVYRPSKSWALRMRELEERDEPLPVTVPVHDEAMAERWREIRKENRGEFEVGIWKRVKRLYAVQHPFWHGWIPFLRYRLEERKMLLHSRTGDIFNVELMSRISFEKRQQDLSRWTDEQADIASRSSTSERCPTARDSFGEIFTTKHVTFCQKGELLSGRVRGGHPDKVPCIMQRHDMIVSRGELFQRHGDFVVCFKNPAKAETVFPLTQGRAYGSVIYQGDYIETLQLPDWRDVTRGLPTPPEVLGLYIEYEFTMKKHEIAMAGVACLTILIVLLWKYTTDSWSTGAGFASVFLTFVGLRIQWKKSAEEGKTKSIKLD